jgi:uncharacterized protein
MAADLHIVVAVPTHDGVHERALVLAPGATVADALVQAGVGAESVAMCATGVWGRVRPRDHVLREGDRVEIYAPLKADPKDARRAKVKPRTRRG